MYTEITKAEQNEKQIQVQTFGSAHDTSVVLSCLV